MYLVARVWELWFGTVDPCLPAYKCGSCLLAVIPLKKEPIFPGGKHMEENAGIWEFEALRSPLWLMYY